MDGIYFNLSTHWVDVEKKESNEVNERVAKRLAMVAADLLPLHGGVLTGKSFGESEPADEGHHQFMWRMYVPTNTDFYAYKEDFMQLKDRMIADQSYRDRVSARIDVFGRQTGLTLKRFAL